jgi:uncharacterized membrane protein
MILFFLILIVTSIFFNMFFIIGTIGLSWHYWKDKSADIDGNNFYTYDEQTRRNGISLGLISIFLTVVLTTAFVFFMVNTSINL